MDRVTKINVLQSMSIDKSQRDSDSKYMYI